LFEYGPDRQYFYEHLEQKLSGPRLQRRDWARNLGRALSRSAVVAPGLVPSLRCAGLRIRQFARARAYHLPPQALRGGARRGGVRWRWGRLTIEHQRGRIRWTAQDLLPVLAELEAAGPTSTRAVAQALNDRGVLTPTGKHWHQTSVVRTL